MASESDPVDPDEIVLRRVLNHSDRIDINLPRPVQRIAFRPTDDDVAGISLFRSRFTTPQEVADSGTNPKGYYVVALPVREFLNLGLTVVPDPRAGQPGGHSLVPELNSLYVPNNKGRSKILQVKLAQLVNQDIDGRLVYVPD